MELKSNGRRIFRDVLAKVVRSSGFAGAMSSKRLKGLLILFAFLFIHQLSYSSTISSKNSGNWNSTSTWNGGSIPGSGDVVTISSGNTVTVNTTASCKSLTVKGTLDMSANLSVAGAVNINTGGSLNCGSSTLSISGSASLTNSGTFTAGTGNVAFSGTSNSTTGTISFNDVTVSNASISFGTGATVNGDLTLMGGYGMSAAPAYGSSSTLKINGSYTVYSGNKTWPSGSGSNVPVNVEVVSGTLNLSWNTLSIRGSITADAGATFDASTTTLSFAGSTPTISGSGTVSLGAITIGSGCTFTMGGDMSIGSLTVSSGGTFKASSYDLTITGGAGSITNSGTFDAGTGTVIFTPQWVGSATTGTIAFNNVICNSAVSFKTGATINGYLQLNGVGITTSPAYGSSATLKINGSYTAWSSDNIWPAGTGSTVPSNVEVVSGTFACNMDVNLKGTLTVDAGATFSCPNNSFTFAGTSNAITGSGTVTLGDVAIGSTCVFTLSSNTTFNTVTINAGGVFNCGSYTLTLKGGYSGVGAITNNGTFNAGTGTVAFIGTSGNTSTGTITYNDVTVSNAPATFNTGATVNGNLTLNSVGLSASPAYGSSSVLKFNGSNTIYSSSATWPTGSAGTVPINIEVVSGTVTLSYATRTIRGNITVDNGCSFDATTSTLTFAGATPVITGNASFGDVIIASGCTFSISHAITFNSLTINSGGTFNTNSNTLTLDGNNASLTSNGTFNAATGIVNMYGASSNTIAGTVILNDVDVKNTKLTFSNAATTTINGTLTLDNTGSSPALSASPVYGSSGRLKFNGGYTIYTADNTWPSGTGTNVAPYIEVAAGTLALNSSRTVKSNLILSGGTISGGTNLVLASGATIDRSNGTLSAAPAFGSTLNLVYSQATGATTTGPELPTSTSVLQAMTINNSHGVTLGANTTINGTLTFSSGILATGSYTATIGASGSISGAGSSAYVNGKLAMYFSSANKSQTYPIGSSNGYAPLALSFASVTSSGNITAYTTGTKHPSISGACINSLKSVNRYWTLSNSGVAPVSFNATFNFPSADVDAGAATASFVVGRYSSATWSLLTAGTRTSTSTEATSVSGFGDFVAGEPGAATITGQPVNTSVCSGSNTTISVAAIGSSLSYQWKVNSGSGWNNISNTGIYSGATTATLTLTGVTTSVNGYQYECVVSSSCGSPSTSSAVTLTVNTAPAIASSPSNSTICSGGNATFAVSATGTGLTYQWQEYNGTSWSNITDGGIYSGATTSSLTLSGATSSQNAYLYKCMVSGTCSPATTSSAATLTINTAPSITSSPSNVTICSGGNATFSVSAIGTALTYQWQEYNGTSWNNITNGGIYSGATTSSLTLTGATNAYQYRCVVSGTCSPAATSSAATLTINTAPSITSSPSNVTICSGGNATFSVSATGTGLTYQWQEYNGTSWGNITNGGIYSGATTSSLTLTGATNAYQYKCIVSGTCSPAVTSSAATLTINSAPSITSSPSNVTICSGGNATFAVSASGTGLTYQWQGYDGSSWNNISGATSDSLTITGATIAGQYRCVVSGTCSPAATSLAATLTINTAPSITSSPGNVTICSGGNATFSVNASGTGLTYQWQGYDGSSWNNISGATSDSLTITGATTAGQYRCVVSGTCSPAATSSAARLTINTAPFITSSPSNVIICSGGNATFAVSATGTALTYQWQSYDGSNWNDISGATSDSLTITGATTAGQYRCVVNGTCSPAATSSAATLTINTAPSITSSPGNVTICSGGNATFAVSATGTALTYQWQGYDGSSWNNISGATSDSLIITGATTAGQYRCVVSGTCSPAATSSAATLTINTAPSITSSPGNVTICSGGNAAFSVSASGTGLTYQWQEYNGTSWSNITNGGIYSGATTSSLTLTGATSSVNTYQYRCIIIGTCGAADTTSSATLSINIVPTISSNPGNSTICAGANTSLTILASGTSLSYQWQEYNGTAWSDISNSGIYSGATTTTLSFTGVTASLNNYQYRCIVSGACSPADTSSAATLTVNVAPAIGSSPSNATACDSGNASFSVSASGTSISYQWQENTGSGWADISNGGIYSGATTAILALTGVNTSMNTYQYRCVVSGSCTSPVYSSAATLSVTQLPSISSQPLSTSTCQLSNAVFSVTASSTASLSYQWQLNDGTGWSNITALNAVYTGYTTNTLTLTSATAAMSGYMYRCQVINCSGFTTTNTVVLTVLPNGTWIGGSSQNWKDPANWCGGLPTATTSVYIDSTAPTMPVTDSTSTITCNDLIIQNGAKVTMGNNLKVNGTLYLYGQLNMATDTLNINGLIVYTTGQMTGNGNSSIVVGGTGSATTLPGVTVKNLQLNRANGLYLGGDVTVKGTLSLTSGKLYVGANTLTINSTPAGTASNLVTTSSSSLNIAGTSSVTIPSSVDTLNNLTINNSAAASSGAVQLNSNVTVNGSLTLTQGYLNLGTNNLTISSSASISGYDSTKYIISNNSPTTGGVLKQNVSNNNTDVIFPLGTTAGYAPIKIKLTAGSTADQYSIRVFDGAYRSGTTGSTYTTHTINKTWYIDEGTVGGTNATLTVGWTRADENSGLNRNKVGIAHYTAGAWNMPASWGSATTANNAYWVSRSGITSFSPFTTVDSTVSQTTVGVNVKVFLQGPFSTSTKTMSAALNTGNYIPTAQPYNVSPWSYSGTESVKSTFFASNRSIVDWVLVELRTGTASSTKVAQRACFIKTDGTLVDTDGVSAVAFNVAAGNYYIVIKHRNHLSVMSASAVSLAIGSNTQYDFTTALTKAYTKGATQMKLLTTGYYGMFAGDGNASGNISAADQNSYWRPQNGSFGYKSGDYNLSGNVSAADLNSDWRPNNGIFSQTP